MTWAYKVDVAPPGAKRQWRSASGFPSKAAAVEALARLQTEREDGTYVEPSKLTLGRYLDDWLAAGPTRGWKGNTMRDYRVSVHHIKAKLGDVRIQELNRAQVEALYGYLLTEGKESRKTDDDSRSGLSRKSVQNVHICLRAALNDAMETSPPLVRRNVAERLGDREDTVLETYGHVTSRMRIGAVSRLAALLDAPADGTSQRSWAVRT